MDSYLKCSTTLPKTVLTALRTDTFANVSVKIKANMTKQFLVYNLQYYLVKNDKITYSKIIPGKSI